MLSGAMLRRQCKEVGDPAPTPTRRGTAGTHAISGFPQPRTQREASLQRCRQLPSQSFAIPPHRPLTESLFAGHANPFPYTVPANTVLADRGHPKGLRPGAASVCHALCADVAFISLHPVLTGPTRDFESHSALGINKPNLSRTAECDVHGASVRPEICRRTGGSIE